jgi:hypothetical protein
MAATAFGGFLLIAAGGLALAGFQFTAADTVGDVPPTVTQTLAALNRDFFFLLDGGVLVAVFATAAATLRHAALPRWYGYFSVAVGLIGGGLSAEVSRIVHRAAHEFAAAKAAAAQQGGGGPPSSQYTPLPAAPTTKSL